MYRDFLKCNPTNTGHYEYPKFENFSYDETCHKRELRNFLKQKEKNKYVVFYTRHTLLNGKSKNKIIGYFKVGKITNNPLGFISCESVLLPKKNCIEINYNSRGVPVSWGNSTIKHTVNTILCNLKQMKKKNINFSLKYALETKKVMNNFLTTPKAIKRFLKICNSCTYQTSCFWGRKQVNKERFLKQLYNIYDSKGCSNKC